MMYVKTKILPSKIHGVGLFADQFIPKGTVIWKFTPGFDRSFSKEEVEAMPAQLQEFMDVYSYLSKKSGLYVLPFDNGRFFNHSTTPNSKSEDFEDEKEVVTSAIVDIEKGEEITDDYALFLDEKVFEENYTGVGKKG